MQGGVTHPVDGYPGPSEAYYRYAAASAQACQRSRWAFFSSLLDAQQSLAQVVIVEQGLA
jgi:hypothetical protein